MQSDTAVAQSTLSRPGEAQASGDLTEGTSVEKPKKKRISGDRAALGVTQQEAYYQAPSLGGGTGVSALLTTSRARIDRQVAYPEAKQKAKAASSASWSGYEEWKEAKNLEVCTKTGAIVSITWDRGDEGTRDALSPGSALRRRHAIHYLFVEVFGAPKEEEWAAPNFHLRLSLPRVIMDMLNIPATSKARVITTMKAIIDAHEAKKEYDPSAAIKAGRGAKVLIEDYTLQAEVVYRVMESGMSLGNTVVVLNQWRRRRTLEPISYGCLQRFARSSAVMVLEKRETSPTRTSGPAAVRGRCTERGNVRQSCASATARARTCLPSQCTLLSWGHTRTSWGPRGAGRRRRGLRSVLAKFKILGWGGAQEAISSLSSLPQ